MHKLALPPDVVSATVVVVRVSDVIATVVVASSATAIKQRYLKRVPVHGTLKAGAQLSCELACQHFLFQLHL